MEKKYWTSRKCSASARIAATSDASLINYELAGSHGTKAAHCLPFTPPGRLATAGAERPVLHLRGPVPARSAEASVSRLGPAARGDPDRSIGEGR